MTFLSRENFLSRDNVYNSVYILPQNLCGVLLTGFSQVEGVWWRRPSLLVKSRDITDRIKNRYPLGLSIKRGLEAWVGVYFFFFLKNAVFSRFIDCVAWRCCRTHYWAAKPQKHARSARERAAKPQFPHSFTALSHLFFARPTKTAILRRLRDLHQQCIFYKNKLQWSTLHAVKPKQI